MRREICGECGAPINDDGACDCTELLKRGWRQCAVGQKTTQWCAIAETLLREQRQRDEALLRQAAHPAITHCDNCGCDWLDNGLNPIGCPYCKQSAATNEALLRMEERVQ